MSTFRDRNVIDITVADTDKNRFLLIIIDDMEWSSLDRQLHAQMLNEKIMDYYGYIASGQAEKAKPGMRPVIQILAQYSFSQYALDFFGRVTDFVKSNGDLCDVEWTHDEKMGPYDDGFSDDFVFDLNKVFPRLKKNWAKDPLNEVSLLSPHSSSPDWPANLVMMRIMEKYIGLFMQDMGKGFTYLTYNMLPEGITVEKLQEAAFQNLARDIKFQICEMKIPGLYGVACGGDFEAESLCIWGIWKEQAARLNDDLVICAPTKDMIIFTKASDKKLVKKLIKKAEEIFAVNRKTSPFLLYSQDVFRFTRSDATLRIDPKMWIRP